MAKKNNEIKSIYSDIAILIFSGLIFFVQLIYDPSALPIGFESAKVLSLKLISLLLFLSILIFAKKDILKDIIKKKYFIAPVLIIFFIIFTASIFSPYGDIAIHGNKFRSLGLITISSFFVIYFYYLLFFREKYFKYLVYAYFIVVLIHAVLGYIDILTISTSKLEKGLYINGSFGQANFFAGLILNGILVSFYLLFDKENRNNKKLRLIFILSIIILFVLLLFTLSYAAIGVAILIFFVVFAYKIIKRYKSVNVRVFDILMSLTLLFALVLIIGVHRVDEARKLYWEAVVDLILKRPIIGFGPDTLLNANEQYGLLPGRYVDRAHNFPLDVFYSFGLLIIMPLTWLGGYMIIQSKKIFDRNEVKLLVSLIAVFFLTSLVHTKSVYQYAELALWLGGLGAFVSNDN